MDPSEDGEGPFQDGGDENSGDQQLRRTKRGAAAPSTAASVGRASRQAEQKHSQGQAHISAAAATRSLLGARGARRWSPPDWSRPGSHLAARAQAEPQDADSYLEASLRRADRWIGSHGDARRGALGRGGCRRGSWRWVGRAPRGGRARRAAFRSCFSSPQGAAEEGRSEGLKRARIYAETRCAGARVDSERGGSIPACVETVNGSRRGTRGRGVPLATVQVTKRAASAVRARRRALTPTCPAAPTRADLARASRSGCPSSTPSCSRARAAGWTGGT